MDKLEWVMAGDGSELWFLKYAGTAKAYVELTPQGWYWFAQTGDKGNAPTKEEAMALALALYRMGG